MKEGLDLREFLIFPVPELQEPLPQESRPPARNWSRKRSVEIQKFQ